MSNIENNIIVSDDMKQAVEQKTEKRKCGRPKKYEGGCKQHERETKYHQNYYHKTNKSINCPICDKEVTSRTLKNHQKSIRCILISRNIVL